METVDGMKICQKFFLVFTSFVLLFLSFAKGDSLAACDPSVMVAEDSSTFTTIQEAYNYASTNVVPPIFTLLLTGEIFTGDLTLNGGAVTLDGGYDCSFTTKNSTSSIFGTITISTGSLNYAADTSNVGIVSTDQCDFDRDGDGYTSIGSCSGTADDCDDNNADIYPGAPEICDGIDNDCNSQIDDGIAFTDLDGDGYYGDQFLRRFCRGLQ